MLFSHALAPTADDPGAAYTWLGSGLAGSGRAPLRFTRTFPGEATQTTSAFTHQLTDDCHLRALEESDAEELHALIEASRDYLSDWMPWAADQTLHGTLQFIRMTRRQLADNNGFQAAIVCRGEIVGVAGFHAIDWANRATSIGYWLGERHQGKGTMTHAVRALVNHAFSVWELNRVEIRAAPHNVRSRAVAERLGFVEEGTLSQAERIGDRYLDNVVYAMLASNWPG